MRERASGSTAGCYWGGLSLLRRLPSIHRSGLTHSASNRHIHELETTVSDCNQNQRTGPLSNRQGLSDPFPGTLAPKSALTSTLLLAALFSLGLGGCASGTPGNDPGGTVAPTITSHPSNQTVTAGQTATFTVVATGTAPLSYQWQKGTTNISGATSASYTTPATTTSDSGSTFRVVVSNSAGSVTSNAATLTVTAAAEAPSITTQPANQTVAAGQTATFT
ncbi:MAG TPA: immunoglobulin domain-containing protein, partial [Candidatus Polarisedimenticolia bacterium]|nr:immunoglobulin domain-containing protein [Candidatus Polarisedimenticolia bacterium]